ncbi:swi5 domain-containing protein [Phthorimaea operculella]|nr:swi5 domain-containing protein [Phthorimaea operculella]
MQELLYLLVPVPTYLLILNVMATTHTHTYHAFIPYGVGRALTIMSKSKREQYEKLLEVEFLLDSYLDGGVKAILVELLHQYNDIKDATQVVINHIANIEGTTVTAIHERLQLTE